MIFIIIKIAIFFISITTYMQHAIVDSKETVEFSFCKLDSFLDMSKTTSKQKTIKLFEKIWKEKIPQK